jgi:hypothetical protein
LSVIAIFTNDESFARSNDTVADCKGFFDSSVMLPDIFPILVCENAIVQNNKPAARVKMFLIKAILYC